MYVPLFTIHRSAFPRANAPNTVSLASPPARTVRPQPDHLRPQNLGPLRPKLGPPSLTHPKNTHPLLHSCTRICISSPFTPPHCLSALRPTSSRPVTLSVAPPPLTPPHRVPRTPPSLTHPYSPRTPTAPLSASKATATLLCRFPCLLSFRNVCKGNCGSFGCNETQLNNRQ